MSVSREALTHARLRGRTDAACEIASALRYFFAQQAMVGAMVEDVAVEIADGKLKVTLTLSTGDTLDSNEVTLPAPPAPTRASTFPFIRDSLGAAFPLSIQTQFPGTAFESLRLGLDTDATVSKERVYDRLKEILATVPAGWRFIDRTETLVGPTAAGVAWRLATVPNGPGTRSLATAEGLNVTEAVAGQLIIVGDTAYTWDAIAATGTTGVRFDAGTQIIVGGTPLRLRAVNSAFGQGIRQIHYLGSE